MTKSRGSVVPQRDFGQEINDMAGSMLVYENILVHLAHIVIARDVVSEQEFQRILEGISQVEISDPEVRDGYFATLESVRKRLRNFR